MKFREHNNQCNRFKWANGTKAYVVIVLFSEGNFHITKLNDK